MKPADDFYKHARYEAVSHCLYDWVRPEKLYEKLAFFQTPAGVNGKTLADTNMFFGGTLPSPQLFLAESIYIGIESEVSFSEMAEEEEFKSGRVEFIIGCKSYFNYAPIGFFPPAFQSPEQKELLKAFSMFQPVSLFPFIFNRKLLIDANQNFSVELFFEKGVYNPSIERVGVILSGELCRPVC